MIAIVFTFIKDGKINDSSPKDWPLENFQPVGSMNRTHTEPDQIGSSSNQVDTVVTIYSAGPLSNFQPVGSTTNSPIKLGQIGSSGNQVDSVTSIVKRSANAGNKRGVFKLELIDDKVKKKAMAIVVGTSGVDSISMNFKKNELTIEGQIDPVNIANELRTICPTELVSVVSIRDEAKKEMETKKDEKKSDAIDFIRLVDVYQANYPRKTPYYHLKTE